MQQSAAEKDRGRTGNSNSFKQISFLNHLPGFLHLEWFFA
jgi:hypothetical protein